MAFVRMMSSEEQNKKSETQKDVSYPGIKEDQIKVARWSLVFPVALSFVFCAVQIYNHFKRDSFSWNWEYFWETINGYLDSTLISTACFVLLQQFFLFIPAGVDKKKGVVLFVVTLIYMFFYSSYISTVCLWFEQLFMLFVSVIFFMVIWFSLDVEDLKVDAGKFSGSN